MIYDRHIYFEAAHGARPGARFSDRLLYRCARCFGKPGLVVFLDAEPALLAERSGGIDPSILARKRDEITRLLDDVEHVLSVDATQEPESVVDEIGRHLDAALAPPQRRNGNWQLPPQRPSRRC